DAANDQDGPERQSQLVACCQRRPMLTAYSQAVYAHCPIPHRLSRLRSLDSLVRSASGSLSGEVTEDHADPNSLSRMLTNPVAASRERSVISAPPTMSCRKSLISRRA